MTRTSTANLEHVHELHGWTIGVVNEPTGEFDPNWHVTANAAGEYFVRRQEASEKVLVWVRTVPTAGQVFSTSKVPAHIDVFYRERRIEISILGS